MEQVVEAMDRGDEMVARNLAVAAEHIENEARDPASVMDLYTDDIVLEAVSYTHLDVYKRQPISI